MTPTPQEAFVRLDIRSHHLRLSDLGGPEGIETMRQFCRSLVQFKLVRRNGRFVKEPERTYAAATINLQEFRFHVNLLDDLLIHLRNRGYREGERLIVHREMSCREDFKAVEFDWVSTKTPRENQPGIVEYVLTDDYPSKMVTLQTGKGKTFISMWCMKELGLRTLICFKGGYVDRWVDDLERSFNFAKGELVILKGSGGLIKLMDTALAGELQAKVIIMTFGTLRDYLKYYELNNGGTDLYPITPEEFYPKLGIGFRIIDEVHQEFHLNFRHDLYTHTFKSLSLSATMTSSDTFMNRVYGIAYPVERRNNGGGYDKYIAVSSLHYNLQEPRKVRCKGHGGGYSHNVLETYLMTRPVLLKAYVGMLVRIIDTVFMRLREDGQRMLIFCASVRFCTLLSEHLQKLYPTTKVARYCQEDDYADLLEADIGVSTVLSAGTAVDIPNLRVTLMTTAIDSRQSNEQALGRTRRLADWPNVTPEFLYLVCDDIERHVVYDRNKRTFFEGLVLSHQSIPLHVVI